MTKEFKKFQFSEACKAPLGEVIIFVSYILCSKVLFVVVYGKVQKNNNRGMEMKLLLRLSLVSICALFLIPASEDWKTGKLYILLFGDGGKIVK